MSFMHNNGNCFVSYHTVDSQNETPLQSYTLGCLSKHKFDTCWHSNEKILQVCNILCVYIVTVIVKIYFTAIPKIDFYQNSIFIIIFRHLLHTFVRYRWVFFRVFIFNGLHCQLSFWTTKKKIEEKRNQFNFIAVINDIFYNNEKKNHEEETRL